MKRAVLSLVLGCITFSAWSQQWIQKGNGIYGIGMGDLFGWSVSMSNDGNTIATSSNQIGDSYVMIYQWNGISWEPKGSMIYIGDPYSSFGWEVDISGDGNTFVLSSPDSDFGGINAGEVRVYYWDGMDWIMKGTSIFGLTYNDNFGRGISITEDGNTLLVGANGNGPSGMQGGYAMVYQWSGSVWLQKGGVLEGIDLYGNFGWSTAISDDGNTVFVGANYNDSIAVDAGQVKSFSFDGTNWIQKGQSLNGMAINDHFGFSISTSSDGNTLAVGAIYNDVGGTDRGSVDLYSWNGTNWQAMGGKLIGDSVDFYFGHSVSLSSDGTMISIGAPFSSFDSVFLQGSVKTFEWSGTDWDLKGNAIIALPATLNEYFGWRVSTSNDGLTLVASAPYNSSYLHTAGETRVYSLNTYSNYDLSSCLSYTSSGGLVYDSDTLVFDTIVNMNGLDSVMLINLDIVSGISYSVVDNGDSLEVHDSLEYVSFQWLDCGEGFLPVSGETDMFFVPLENGQYSVIVNQGSCIDTSECLIVDWVGVTDNVVNSEDIKVFPNPVIGESIVYFTTYHKTDLIQLIDITGKVIFTSEEDIKSLDLASFVSGIYTLRFFHKNEYVAETRIVRM